MCAREWYPKCMKRAHQVDYLRAMRTALGEGINLSEDAIREVWAPIYMMTWGTGCPPVVSHTVWSEFIEQGAADFASDKETLSGSSIADELDTDLGDHDYVEHVWPNLVSGGRMRPTRSLQMLDEFILPTDDHEGITVLGALRCWPALARLPYVLDDPDEDEIAPDVAEKWLRALRSVWAAIPTYNRLYVMKWPNYVHIDVNGELHCPDAPAIEIANGRHLWMLHGHQLPHGLRTTKKRAELPVGALVTYPDEGLREVMCAERGWAQIAETVGFEVIQDSGDPHWGRVIRVWIPGGPRHFLDAMCGTGRRVCLPIDSSIETVNGAQEALHGGTPFWILRTAERRT